MEWVSALAHDGLRWPAILPARAAQLTALLYQLGESERWSPEAVLRSQQRQFELLFGHAKKQSPFYAERFRALASIPELGSAEWRMLPLLTRRELLRRGESIRSGQIPKSHGEVRISHTSGSTGQPVAILRTGVCQLIWQAIALREHVWLERDATLSNAVIRVSAHSAPAPQGKKVAGWGVPYDWVWKCGESLLLDLNTDVAVQARWLQENQPSYLLTYPSNLDRLLSRPEAKDLNLRQVLCIGETVSDQLRAKSQEIKAIPLVTNYSSKEVGYIALQCAACGQLHVQSESVYVEVLDDSDHPCDQGQIGRVVITDMHNFAMPLIRYEIGDYAEVGGSCAARPGLTSIRRILGRRRNMVRLPDGKEYWPRLSYVHFNEVAPINQYQFIQRSREEIEVRLVAEQRLTGVEVAKLNSSIKSALGYPFQLRFRQWPCALPKTKGGKFEEFVCMIS